MDEPTIEYDAGEEEFAPAEFEIEITEVAESAEDMADTLEKIARDLRQGYTNGYYPHWKLTKIK